LSKRFGRCFDQKAPKVMAPIGLMFCGPYHRNDDGNLAMPQLMLAPPSAVHQILSDHQVDYVVVVCRAVPIKMLSNALRTVWSHCWPVAKSKFS
jgi:hypothetical protein